MSLDRSFSENRKRRIAQFKNNWGNLEQIDQDINEVLEKKFKIYKLEKPPSLIKKSPSSSLLHMNVISSCSTDIENKESLLQKECSAKNKINNPLNDSFCDCKNDKLILSNCHCGEPKDFLTNWNWDENAKSIGTCIREEREIFFHFNYSNGTAIVRGNKVLSKDEQHFWEIKLISPVYGTDMMIGIGTKNVDLNKNQNKFISMLGEDTESWGLSYDGTFHHNGDSKKFSTKFTQGTIIGIHLDTWNGKLSFYKNRQLIGVACKSLFKNKCLYPMASSTAARSAMRLIRSKSIKNSLFYLCCLTLRKIVPTELNVLEVLNLPPGLNHLLKNNLDWLLSASANNIEK